MAGWRVWAERLETADFVGVPRMFQTVKFHKNIILKGMRTWVIVYNNPNFTNLEMRIYANHGGVQGKLLYTSSNVITKAQMITLANGVKEIFFDFDTLPIFKDEDTYLFTLMANGYTGDATSHIAWMRAYPDPVYRTGLSALHPTSVPMAMYFIGSEL